MSYVKSLMKLEKMSPALWFEWIDDNEPTSKDVLSFSEFLELHNIHKHTDNYKSYVEPNLPVDPGLFKDLLKYASYLDEHNVA